MKMNYVPVTHSKHGGLLKTRLGNIVLYGTVWTVRTGGGVFCCLLRKLLKKSLRYLFVVLTIAWAHFMPTRKIFAYEKRTVKKHKNVWHEEVSS